MAPAAKRPAPGQSATLVSTEPFQSINPCFVVVLIPLLVGLFASLRRRGKEPSTPAGLAWRMVIAAASTLPRVGAVTIAHGGQTKAAGWWLVGTCGVITVGTLFLSPLGLSMISKQAPPRVTAPMMDGWFLAISIGGRLAGVLAGLWGSIPLVRILWVNCAAALAAAGAIAVMIP
jgi:POT family proton-dependent oligopeptide transporter